jgi:hypothetical protein
MRTIREQQITLVADGICLQAFGRQELPDFLILQARENDCARRLLGCSFFAGNPYLDSSLIANFLRQCFRGDAVFRLMSKLHNNPCGRLHLKTAGVQLHFLGLRNQL